MRPLACLALLSTVALPASASAQDLSTIECATYRAVLAASGESVKALARGAREIDLTSLRNRGDEETKRAIARLEDANTNLQPAMQEWAAAAAALSERVKALCSR
jgi:hypothetical protein